MPFIDELLLLLLIPVVSMLPLVAVCSWLLPKAEG